VTNKAVIVSKVVQNENTKLVQRGQKRLQNLIDVFLTCLEMVDTRKLVVCDLLLLLTSPASAANQRPVVHCPVTVTLKNKGIVSHDGYLF
jgi:hypothetical protein